MALPERRGEHALQPLPRRVVIGAPPGGFGRQLAIMQAWLDAACGPAGWSAAPAGSGGVRNDAVAFYFADAVLARAFIDRFCCGYRARPRDAADCAAVNRQG